jgi:hypothetical protein
MRAKRIYEGGFSRGQDPKTTLGIGIPYKNPMPRLNAYIDEALENLPEIHWGLLDKEIEEARKALVDYSIAVQAYKVFGRNLQYLRAGTSYGYDKVLGLSVVLPDGKTASLGISLNPSGEYRSFYAELPDPVNAKTAYYRTPAKLITGIIRTLNDHGITLK